MEDQPNSGDDDIVFLLGLWFFKVIVEVKVAHVAEFEELLLENFLEDVDALAFVYNGEGGGSVGLSLAVVEGQTPLPVENHGVLHAQALQSH